jgi:hypothetical protein
MKSRKTELMRYKKRKKRYRANKIKELQKKEKGRWFRYNHKRGN